MQEAEEERVRLLGVTVQQVARGLCNLSKEQPVAMMLLRHGAQPALLAAARAGGAAAAEEDDSSDDDPPPSSPPRAVTFVPSMQQATRRPSAGDILQAQAKEAEGAAGTASEREQASPAAKPPTAAASPASDVSPSKMSSTSLSDRPQRLSIIHVLPVSLISKPPVSEASSYVISKPVK